MFDCYTFLQLDLFQILKKYLEIILTDYTEAYHFQVPDNYEKKI